MACSKAMKRRLRMAYRKIGFVDKGLDGFIDVMVELWLQGHEDEPSVRQGAIINRKAESYFNKYGKNFR